MNSVEILINSGIEESEARRELEILEEEFSDKERIKSIVKERARTRKPIQYLLGKAYFMDFEVRVNENILIPRPETEILVEETINRIQNIKGRVQGLDIGTGSGIIPISICRKIKDIKFTAIDIKKEVIELAKGNAESLDTEEKINFKICDVFTDCFEGLLKAKDFNLITSNPPYVLKENATQEELKHEPSEALFGNTENPDGLRYYKRIISLTSKLKAKSQKPKALLLALEIDPSLTEGIKAILKNNNLNNYEIVKDYSENDRCLFVRIN